MKPGRQLHMGLWLTTRHWALAPHEPGQGSAQVSLIQARVRGHSALSRHSGRQEGGLPTAPGRHEHTTVPRTSLHTPQGPHGLGAQGGGLAAGGAGGARAS